MRDERSPDEYARRGGDYAAPNREEEYRKALVAIGNCDGSWDAARYARDVLDDNEQDDYSLNPYTVAIALETLADTLKGLARERT